MYILFLRLIFKIDHSINWGRTQKENLKMKVNGEKTMNNQIFSKNKKWKKIFSKVLIGLISCFSFFPPPLHLLPFLGEVKNLEFISEIQKESNQDLFNPGCGWYHVYTFRAEPEEGKPVDQEIWLDESSDQERLALVLIDLGSFQDSLLSQASLDHIAQIMEFFSAQKKDLVVRFTYDVEGKGLEHEPESIDLIKDHMKQVYEVIEPYLNNILLMQGIFVGSWGEMHDSKFLDVDSMSELINTLYTLTRGQCFLAVRTPLQWRTLQAASKVSTECLHKLGIFNDGIFGSITDLGTYGNSRTGKSFEKWERSQELNWQNDNVRYVLNGGEVLAHYPLKSYTQAIPEFQKMHVSYLNSVYQLEQLNYWKDEQVEEIEGWEGVSGYDYIGRHLGYRFSVVDVIPESWNTFKITIQNTGFSNLCEEAECLLGIETKEKMIWQPIYTDPRTWEPSAQTVISVSLPKKEIMSGTKLYLSLRRKSDGLPIQFANQGAQEFIFLGELHFNDSFI